MTFSRIRLGLLLVALTLPAPAVAAPAAPELLVQRIDLNEPHVQAKGKVALRSLKPLAWELELERYDGDPKPLAKTLALISSQAAKVLGDAGLAWVRLEGLHGHFEQGELTARLAHLELPEGGIRQVNARWSRQGQWSLTARQGSLGNVPIAMVRQLGLQPLAFTSLQANGSALDGSGRLEGVTLPGLKARQARFQARLGDKPLNKGEPLPTRVNLDLEGVTPAPGGDSWFPGLLKHMGLPTTAKPYALQLTFSVVEEPGRIRLEELELSAPMVHTQGRAELLPRENPPLLLVDLHTQPRGGKPQRVVKRIPLQAAGS